MIDLCYGSVSSAYKSLPLPSLGASYHNCVFLIPVYKPALRHLDHEEKEIKIWSDVSHRGEGCPVLGFLSCEFHVLF